MNIGLYHPQRINKIATSTILNLKLENRVKCVNHIFDLFSPQYAIAILIEPELLSNKYNPKLVSLFMQNITKPIIVVPYYKRNHGNTRENVTFLSCNPKSEEVIREIARIEEMWLKNSTKTFKT